MMRHSLFAIGLFLFLAISTSSDAMATAAGAGAGAGAGGASDRDSVCPQRSSAIPGRRGWNLGNTLEIAELNRTVIKLVGLPACDGTACAARASG